MVLPGTTRPTRGRGANPTHGTATDRGLKRVRGSEMGEERVYVVYLDEPCATHGRDRHGRVRATHRTRGFIRRQMTHAIHLGGSVFRDIVGVWVSTRDRTGLIANFTRFQADFHCRFSFTVILSRMYEGLGCDSSEGLF